VFFIVFKRSREVIDIACIEYIGGIR